MTAVASQTVQRNTRGKRVTENAIPHLGQTSVQLGTGVILATSDIPYKVTHANQEGKKAKTRFVRVLFTQQYAPSSENRVDNSF